MGLDSAPSALISNDLFTIIIRNNSNNLLIIRTLSVVLYFPQLSVNSNFKLFKYFPIQRLFIEEMC